MRLKGICSYILFGFFVLSLQAQEVPPIQIFTPQDYGAEDQNWAITQDDEGYIYVANNAGLLEYNGAVWKLYKSPNQSILRSVKSVENRLYTGGYMDFGFWSKNAYGKFVYTSLVEDKVFTIKEDEEFWGIIDVQGYVLFQSFERIYIYNTEDNSFNIIESDKRINKIYKVDENIYFQKNDEGIFKIENGSAQLVISSDILGNLEIVNLFSINNDLLLQSKTNGFYVYKNDSLNRWKISSEDLISNYNVYSSTRLQNGGFVLGTISNGIIILDKEGKLVLQKDQSDGLSNNTVLSLKEDVDGNLWLGLDNGIDVINLNSPLKVYRDTQGVLGTVYASALVDGFLYLGTNQGLFYRASNSEERFKFVPGTKGQVWTLKFLKGTLFCGHDQGTFTIKDGIATKIADEIGTWDIKPIASYPNLLIQGNYRGLNVLEYKNGQWKYRNKIEGFDISSRYFEFSGANEILVSHEYKGVYKIDVSRDFLKVLGYNSLPIGKGEKSGIVAYNDSIFYSYKEGVFKYDIENEVFIRDSILSDLFCGRDYLSGKLINDKKNNRLWGFTNEEIIYIEPGNLSKQPEATVAEIPNEVRKAKPGFENLLHLQDENYLIGNTEGYFVLDMAGLKSKSNKLYLNEVAYTSLHEEFKRINFNETITLKNQDNSIRFRYSMPSYEKFSISKFQYRLLGIYDEWSNWSINSEVLFENLPFGDYQFEVRAKSGNIPSSNTVSYNFTIEKPWYLKPLAITAYILGFLVFVWLLFNSNKRYYRKQQQKILEEKERELELEQLDNQRQIMEFKNKTLQLDIDNKNRELGAATMNLVKRNELLNDIKDQLSKSKSLDDVNGVIKIINSSLNNTNDWKLFEEAFNNVDKDFMKKIKSLHPSITTNDLRLCAYLRLNLSSKEIAPLLNISHKSVEVKRYRLRKKMGLSQNQSLSDYIIEL